MTFGGTTEPCAYGTLKSIGGKANLQQESEKRASSPYPSENAKGKT